MIFAFINLFIFILLNCVLPFMMNKRYSLLLWLLLLLQVGSLFGWHCFRPHTPMSAIYLHRQIITGRPVLFIVLRTESLTKLEDWPRRKLCCNHYGWNASRSQFTAYMCVR